ncbi:MAG: alanine racemase [Clostridia bacterium]|nr:alanine racemase [Clostridia bacterium]
MRKVIAKIDLENIRYNAKAFLKRTGKPICAVVKANAYGHGAEEVVNALEDTADCFAVSLLDEALAIRVAACGKDVLILTPPNGENEIVSAAKNGFILTVGDYSTAKLVAAISQRQDLPIRVHLKANTGMNRYGMDLKTLKAACAFLSGYKSVCVEGLYSHIYEYSLATAERQRLSFLHMQAVARGYFPKLTCHLSATYGAMLGKEFVFDMTRIGIGLYGYMPDGANDIPYFTLRKAMSVWAEVSAIGQYRTGGIGYGKAAAEENASLSVIRFGYADGYLRRRENGVCGWEYNANNLCMDACIRLKKGRKGQWLPVMTDAAETARLTGTISYEVLCAATRRAEMVYDDVTFCGRTRTKKY